MLRRTRLTGASVSRMRFVLTCHFYLWGALSLLIFRFSRCFRLELRPLRFRNLLLYLPVILLKGLKAAREREGAVRDPLRPSWGEPELLMNLVWSNLNRSKPNLDAAEQYARSALALVPYWHYVRDILLPQITAARLKQGQVKGGI
jgi:hypothetical protein